MVCPGRSLKICIPPSPRSCCRWWCPEDAEKHCSRCHLVPGPRLWWLTWATTSEGNHVLGSSFWFHSLMFLCMDPRSMLCTLKAVLCQPCPSALSTSVGSEEEIWAKSHHSVFPQITAAIAAVVIVIVAIRANIFMCQVV